MRRIPCDFLRPGMEVASNIYTTDGRVLLAKGVKLNGLYIKRLAQKGYTSVYIEEDISRDIYVSDVVFTETRMEAIGQIRKTAANVCTHLVNRDTINIKDIKSSVADIISQIMENKELIYDLMDVRTVDDYLFSHSVNVCVLSVLTGIAMNYNFNQLEQLAVGAILHDLGKALVPPHILNKSGKLSDSEFAEIKKHPAYSLELLRTNPGISSVSRVIAYEHHERYNGEGYPLKKAGDEIMEMSQIVGMVDVYDAITANRCYREALPANEAYELLSGSGDHYYRFDIVRSFLSKIAAYPSGSFVQLSNNQIAIVVKNSSKYPITPKVRLLIEPDGTIIKPFRELDLAGQTKIVIKRIFNEKEVQEVIARIQDERLTGTGY